MGSVLKLKHTQPSIAIAAAEAIKMNRARPVGFSDGKVSHSGKSTLQFG